MGCKQRYILNSLVSHKDTKRTKVFSLCLCGILLLATSCRQQSNLPYYNTADLTPAWTEGKTNMHTIPAFSFIDQNNNTVSEKTFDNKIYIANFFFTTCGVICPRMT